MTDIQPRVLIEDWLPVAELGIESRRERAAASALPPLSFLHVWWARRPLVASAAVVLAGLLPAWTQQLADEFPDANQLQTEKAYRRWLLDLVGIWGDPIAGRKAIDAAKIAGVKLDGNGYGYKQAFRNHPDRANVDLLHQVLVRTWGELPTVADPTAGGGSIPFTAARLGLPVFANDLNPVASTLLKAGVEFPARHGAELLPHLEKWGGELVGRIQSQLREFFPLREGEQVIAYIWANAVSCPRSGRLVPLLTDRWLRKEKGKEVAVRLVTEVDGVELREPLYEIVTGSAVDANAAGAGIVSGGKAISPYDNLVIDGAYIKAEAKAGRMTQVMYAVAIRTSSGTRAFRSVTDDDRTALANATAVFSERRAAWESAGILPTEEIPDESNYERGHRMYGIRTWVEMFTPRQALVHATFSAEFMKLIPEVRAARPGLHRWGLPQR